MKLASVKLSKIRCCSKLKGITLVELMVSVALGLVIMASLSTVLFDTAQLTKLGMSEVQTLRQLERTMDILETTVELAGFVPDIAVGVTKISKYEAKSSFKAGEVVQFETKGENASNVLKFRTTGFLDTSVDCLGKNIPNDTQVIMTLYHDVKNQTLVCDVQGDKSFESGVLLDNVIFVAMGYTGALTGSDVFSKVAYSEPTPNAFDIRGVVIDIVVESDTHYFSKSIDQEVIFFLGKKMSFKSKGKVSKVRRVVPIKNVG
jgi:Tfp pilus assembly protein PilW